jgi:Tfp pilus assembly pilus retraction ATPase PilT
MFDVKSLPPLTAADWHRARDIVLPIEKSVGGDTTSLTETLVQQGYAFVGELGARRLWNEMDPTLCEKLAPIISTGHERVSEGFQRFRIDHADMSFRAQVGRNADGHDLSLRVLPKETPKINEINLPPNVRQLFLGGSVLEGGLILIVGPFGQGKTTTASAIVRSRLEVFGGYALTVEDPCELPLQGVWGKGICMQRPVEAIDAYEPPGDAFFRALIGTLRQFPAIPYGTMLFVGEIQDSRTAIETLKAAVNGHLVIATLHARSPADAVRRMAMLCAGGRDNLDPDTAREMLSVALKGVWYQRLNWLTQGQGWSRGELTGSILWNKDEVVRTIRGGKFDGLGDIAKKQTDTLIALRSQLPLSAEEIERHLGN